MIENSHAELLLAQYATDTLLHNQQVGHIMRWFAKQLGQDHDRWYVTGLLHDVDRDYIHKDASKHLKDDFVQIINQLPYTDDIKTQLIEDIRSHGPRISGVEPTTLIQQYLISIDELSGLMYAYGRMRGGFDGMEVKGVIKRIKTPSFAAGVDREHVRNCEHYLNIPLEEFVEQMILAFQNTYH